MQIMRTRKDPTHLPEDSSPPTYLNTETHSWDGSQLYGSNADAHKRVRSGEDGKLLVGADGMLPHRAGRPGVEGAGVLGRAGVVADPLRAGAQRDL